METKKGKLGILVDKNIYVGSEKYENKVVTRKELANILNSIIIQDFSVSVPQPEIIYDPSASVLMVRANLTKDAIEKILQNGGKIKLYLFRENHNFTKNWTHPEPNSIKTSDRANPGTVFTLQTEWSVSSADTPILSISRQNLLNPIVFDDLDDGGINRISPTEDAPWHRVRVAGSQRRKTAPIKKIGKIDLDGELLMKQVRHNYFNFTFAFVIEDETSGRIYLGPLGEIFTITIVKGSSSTSYGCVEIKSNNTKGAYYG